MREKKPKAPTKTEIARDIADKIHAHLERFESTEEINYPRKFVDGQGWVKTSPNSGSRPYYMAFATGVRHRVCIRYISYQGSWLLDIPDAERYLAWLDAGNEGRHIEALGPCAGKLKV
jgi:hypothetical protein